MIEKPDIDDEKIVIALNQNYSIQVSHIEFLPIGNDASAFSYRVDAKNGITYFLKIKMQLSNLAGLFVPRFLKDNGIQQVTAPLSTKTGELWVNIDQFALILYPFIVGDEAMRAGMSDPQWTEFGAVLKQIHFTEVPSDISSYVSRETFVSKWGSFARELDEQVATREYDDLDQKKLAVFWKKNRELIQILIEQTERIGKHLQDANLEFVLCHADIHTANILIARERDMFIVDWDETLLAPKERDLMFVPAEDTQQGKLFFNGYGNANINQLALAYYRYEWCIQEIGDFGNRVFLTIDADESTKQNAVKEFIKLFSQGDVIEGALNTSFEFAIRNHS